MNEQTSINERTSINEDGPIIEETEDDVNNDDANNDDVAKDDEEIVNENQTIESHETDMPPPPDDFDGFAEFMPMIKVFQRAKNSKSVIKPLDVEMFSEAPETPDHLKKVNPSETKNEVEQKEPQAKNLRFV